MAACGSGIMHGVMFRGRSCILAAFVAFTLAVGLPAAVAGADEYAFTLVAQSTPTELQAGSTVTVPLTLRNDGTVAWVPGRSFHVAYHWSEPDGRVVVWDGARSELPQEVVPGATVELDATLTAPAAAGRYLLQWDLVRENVCWFSERMAEVPPGVPVQVEAVPPVHAFSVVKQDAPRWMLSGAGRSYMLRAPLLAIWPGLALTVVVYGINMFGDAMRDLLDPRLRGGIGSFSGHKKKKKKNQ